jgi:enolase
MLAIDGAVSDWFDEKDGCYHLPKRGITMTRAQMVDMYADFAENYPIISIEDGMAEDDWEGWKMLTDRLGKKVQLVGDDLFVTNVKRFEKGLELGVCNSILIKLNQIGTLTETLDTISKANRAGYTAVVLTAAAKRRIPPSPICPWLSTPDRSRPVPPAAQTGLPNIISCCASRKSWAVLHITRDVRHFLI